MTTGLRHGKWWDQWRGVPVQDIMEGRFDRLFDPSVAPPADFNDADLEKLAAQMTAGLDTPPTPETEVDPEENTGIVAAYTYLGQFVDHDITFDPASQLRHHTTDLNKLVDFRTPRLDLDCLYGRGPSDQPYIYAPDGRHFSPGRPLSGNPHDPAAFDLPRAPNGRALIGDPRNDENRIVAQLHAAMLRFHNRVCDLMPDASFDEIRNQVRWHYQWVVVNDYLPTIIQADVLAPVFPHLGAGTSVIKDRPTPTIRLLTEEAHSRHGFFMPVEFSVAAYRYGHSMVRPIYRLNETISRRTIFGGGPDPAGDLGGMRPIPDDWAIDWQFFIDLNANQPAPTGEISAHNANDPIPRTPQHAYKIDTSVVNPLGFLPPSVASNPASLPLRNLLRGRDFQLPSGQTVAHQLGITPIPDDDLVIGKATDEDPKQPITSISNAFAGRAPLWAYVLSEAQVTSWAAAKGRKKKDSVPIRLGPVGGRLIAEVFAAMLLCDRTSLLHSTPRFQPVTDLERDERFGLADLLRAALQQAAEPAP